MVHKSFAYYAGIDEYKLPAVAVPFLQGRDASVRHSDIHGFVVFTDAVMRVFLVILVEEDLPAAVEFFQGMDPGDLDLGNETVDDLMEFFDSLSEYSDKKSYPQFFIIRTF